MATANFNTNIKSDSIDKLSYDLSVIITTNGFTDKLTYNLIEPPNGVSTKENTLIIDPKIYGTVTVEVSDGIDTAVTATDITGFYADSANMINNNVNYNEAIDTIRNNWSTLVDYQDRKKV
jgi:hypothetical protein